MYLVGLVLLALSWAIAAATFMAVILSMITRHEPQPEHVRWTTRRRLRDSTSTVRRALAGRQVGAELRRYVLLLEIKRRRHIAILQSAFVIGGISVAGWMLIVAPPHQTLPELSRAAAGLIITSSALYLVHDSLDRAEPVLPMLVSVNMLVARRHDTIPTAPAGRGHRIRTDLLDLRRAAIAAAQTIEHQTQGAVGPAKRDVEGYMAGTALAILELQQQVIMRTATPQLAETVRDHFLAIVNYDFTNLPTTADHSILVTLHLRGLNLVRLLGWTAIPVTGMFLILKHLDASPYLALLTALLAILGPALDLYRKHR